ncbi:MAG: helix-turn-helix domain-containing protein [Spirochaetes bacterium]|nr:helix-turn-helix domain-containing protein [Spirochaetota bacterium]
MKQAFYSTHDIALILQISDDKIYNLIKSGNLKDYKLGHRTYRISKEQFNIFLKKVLV